MMAVTTAETSVLDSSNTATFEKNRLIISEHITRDQWRDLGYKLKTVDRSVQLWIGDWAREGEKRGFYTSSKTYDEIAEITGISRRTLQDYKTVADRVSAGRHADLSFAHHREVAPLPPDLQSKLLERAAEEKLSIRQLRDEVRKTLPRKEQRALNVRDEVTRISQLENQAEQEHQILQETVSRLLEEINALPPAFRRQIKKAIKG